MNSLDVTADVLWRLGSMTPTYEVDFDFVVRDAEDSQLCKHGQHGGGTSGRWT